MEERTKTATAAAAPARLDKEVSALIDCRRRELKGPRLVVATNRWSEREDSKEEITPEDSMEGRKEV